MYLSLATRRRLLGLAPQVLYHGTRYMAAILRDNELGVPGSGYPSISFTRCPDVAARFANVGPRDWDEGRGGIIAIDRRKLASRHQIHTYFEEAPVYEAEEYVDAPIENLSSYIVGTFWLDELVPGAGLMPPRRVCRNYEGPATSLAVIARRMRRLARGRTAPDAYHDEFEKTIVLIEKWIGVEA